MNGQILFMILVMVWLCFRSSCMIMPRRGACVFCLRMVFCIVIWIGSGFLGKNSE